MAEQQPAMSADAAPRWRQIGDHHLLLGDAFAGMYSLLSECVDSIVTSPPYGDQRAYGGADPSVFVDWIEPMLVEGLRVLRPGGSMLLNLGRIMRKGEEHPYALDVLYRARELGWKWVDTIVWHKPNAIPLSHPAYLHGMHEWVWWLAPSTDCYRGYDRDTRRPHAEGSIRRVNDPYMTGRDERYRKRGKASPLHPDGARPSTVVRFGVGSTRGVAHPAVMVVPLARHLVALATPPGGMVLDPFTGSGTTQVAAEMLGRRSIGIDHTPSYLDIAARRLRAAASEGGESRG